MQQTELCNLLLVLAHEQLADAMDETSAAAFTPDCVRDGGALKVNFISELESLIVKSLEPEMRKMQKLFADPLVPRDQVNTCAQGPG